MTGIFTGVDRSHRALDYHLRRHEVLASNLANVDTPGFRPSDLVRVPAEEEETFSLRLVATHRRHVGELDTRGLPAEELREDRTINPGNDGNGVSLERELSKVAANQLRYDGVSRVVQRQLGLLRYAASDGTSG